MKLLLTSTGITNDSLKQAATDLMGKQFNEASVVYIPTAAFAESGSHEWLMTDLNRTYGLGWGQFNALELNGLPKEVIVKRLQAADAIYVEGGNVYHLARSIIGNDLTDVFLELLDAKVYIGASAGSMVFSKNLSERTAAIFGESDELYQIHAKQAASPFNLFDWYLKPHFYSQPERDDAWLDNLKTQIDFPVYAIDDNTALKVIDGGAQVVTEGKWRLI
ncbi:MAG TPA: Type 1 glutamine amidotransferase-like domain-containing protein [Candidatus Saccharimonadales bacterium]|nr:Type 1 glutamine amidotransferase-like domain-containing protein [Candidatus Saccharimonadales bacterium]